MEFNPSKCQVLHFSKFRHPVSTQYSLHNQALESVDGAKYLGVHLSKDLSWNTHVNNITSAAYKTFGFVKRNIRQRVYKTLVRTQLEYTSNVWSPSTKVNIDKIEMTQDALLAGLNQTPHRSSEFCQWFQCRPKFCHW